MPRQNMIANFNFELFIKNMQLFFFSHTQKWFGLFRPKITSVKIAQSI